VAEVWPPFGDSKISANFSEKIKKHYMNKTVQALALAEEAKCKLNEKWYVYFLLYEGLFFCSLITNILGKLLSRQSELCLNGKKIYYVYIKCRILMKRIVSAFTGKRLE
jgi:hypothetical protein